MEDNTYVRKFAKEMLWQIGESAFFTFFLIWHSSSQHLNRIFTVRKTRSR